MRRAGVSSFFFQYTRVNMKSVSYWRGSAFMSRGRIPATSKIRRVCQTYKIAANNIAQV